MTGARTVFSFAILVPYMELALSVPRFVRKRDNTTVQDFDLGKVIAAIEGAWREVKGEDGDVAVVRAAREAQALLAMDPSSVDTAAVERIQDAVELALMRAGHFDVAKAYILYRQKRTEIRNAPVKPDPDAISQYIHASKYARWREDLGRRELFHETVERVRDMHLRKFEHLGPAFAFEIREAFRMVAEKRVLPSMRTMQFAGKAIEVNNLRGFNCSATLMDRPRAFAEVFYLLLCGCGVGYSVQKQHVAEMPPIAAEIVDTSMHIVQDTIEGWADALDALICGMIEGRWVTFDYSQVREKGALLKTSGGRAPGPGPLRDALNEIQAVLTSAMGRHLNTFEVHRINCHAADAVLSGGIRRSAMIALFSVDDEEMLRCKADASWFDEMPWLARANNSVMFLREHTSEQDFRRVFEMTREYGEPGFMFVDNLDDAWNPCAEALLKPTIGEETGFGFCVSGDTRLLTRTGVTTIRDAVGLPTEIWNGEKWQTVTPFVTGANRALLRVMFSDGSYLDCTPNHKFIVSYDNYGFDQEVEAKDLMNLSKRQVRLPRQNVSGCDGSHYDMAYELGALAGDGYVETSVTDGRLYERTVVTLYGKPKMELPLRGTRRGVDLTENGVPFQDVVLDVDLTLAKVLKCIDSIPSNIFGWDEKSICAFAAGWADTDGSQANCGVRIYGTQGRMRDLQLLLTKVGVVASLNFMQDVGAVTNLGVRQVAMWYLQIPDARKLPCRRLNTSNGKPAQFKGKYQVVRSVTPLPGLHTTYCVTEPERHMCLFNNVLTKQCNLTTMNAAMFRTLDDFIRAARAATLIGTLQASYTDFPYLSRESREIAERDALLGVSMTGMQDAPDVALAPDNQRLVAELVKQWNAEFARIIGIRPAARTTLGKPEGTSSLVLSCRETPAVASGIHPHHAERYIRRVTANALEIPFQAFRNVNPDMCEEKPNGDWVIMFPVQIQDGARTRYDMSAMDFLRTVHSTQKNWVVPGTTRDQGTHNQSNTVNVRPEEWGDVADYLWENRMELTGVSFMPWAGDTVYPFAPFEAVVTPEQDRLWLELARDFRPVDYASVREYEDSTSLKGEVACAGGACEWGPR